MTILILNQTFAPDLQATAQHASDLARELAAQGHAVTAIAGRQAYGRPGVLYPRVETWYQVRIHRVGAADPGKSSRLRRAVNFASFLAAAAWRLLRTPRHDVVIALTSPPLITVLGALFARLKGGRLVSWIMDLNPDEAIAAGWLKPRSLTTRALKALMRWSLRRSDTIIVLDRFMQARVATALSPPAPGTGSGVPSEARGHPVPVPSALVIPPGARDLASPSAPRAAFRRAHNIDDKYVVMYSGNHSPCHPLTTLLEAAERLAADPRFVFLFVGGGSEHPKVAEFARARNLTNIRTLPYQPEERLAASLSAGDLHAVVMGDAFVGIVHPSKIYNILALGLPVLYIGPEESHITDLAQGQASLSQSAAAWTERPVPSAAVPCFSQSAAARTERPVPSVFYAARHGDPATVAAHIESAWGLARVSQAKRVDIPCLSPLPLFPPSAARTERPVPSAPASAPTIPNHRQTLDRLTAAITQGQAPAPVGARHASPATARTKPPVPSAPTAAC